MQGKNTLDDWLRFRGYPKAYIFFAFLLCLSIQKANAQTTDTLSLTLEETLESAITDNPEILLSHLQVQNAISQLKEVKGSFWPQLNINGQYTRNIKRPVFFLPPGSVFGKGGGNGEGTIIEAGFDNSYRLIAQTSLPIYNRELILNAKVAEASVKIQKKGLAISRNTLKAEVKKAYFNALLAKESLKVLNQSLENAQSNFENIKNTFEQELVPEYDVIRAEVKVANLLPEIMQGKNNYEAALSNLKLLANIPQKLPVTLAESLETLYKSRDADLLATYSILDNPQLQQLDVRQSLQKQQINVQQASFYPTFSAFGNYAFQAQANDFNFSDYRWVNTSSVGLQLTIPVFQGLARLRQVEQARISLKQTKVQKRYKRKSLSIQAQNALNRLQRARISLKAQKQNIAQAKKAYQIAQVSYNSGVGTLIEVNDAELALTQARLNQLEIIYEYLNALADFYQLTGNETNE